MTIVEDPQARVRARISEIIAGSSVPEDPRHSTNTLEWLLKLEPGADVALQLAALGHDIDRAVESTKVLREDFCDYDAFKSAHAKHSAEMLLEILSQCDVRDSALADELYRLVSVHEIGGDARSNLLVDADSISYFDVNLPLYHQRNSREESLRRCIWGYRRLSDRGRRIAAQLRPPGDELAELMEQAMTDAAP